MQAKLSINQIFKFFSIIVLVVFILFAVLKKSFFLLLLFLFLFFSFCTIYFTKFKNYNLFFSSVFFVLSLTEISINSIYSYITAGKIEKNKPATYHSNDSSYGSSDYWITSNHGHTPKNGTYSSKKLTTDGEIIYDVRYTINKNGQRIGYVTNSPMNVNFFGCSFTFGEGLNDNETLPYLYGQLKNINTNNFGFHGYGAHNALYILNSIDNNPGDINIIITGLFHIKRQTCSYDWTANHPKYSLKNKLLIYNGKCVTPYQKLIRKVLNQSNIFKFSKNLMQNKKTNKNDLDTYIAILKKMHYISKVNNQKFIIGFLDNYSDGFDKNSIEYVTENIKNFSDQFILIDLPTDGAFSIPIDGHPSYYSNQQLAKFLNKNIEIKF